MIEVRNISFAYGQRSVLRDVSFSAAGGECVAVLGNNGAGKSTLITCINRIRRPSSGDVLIGGRRVGAMGRGELARAVAYVAQKNEMSRAAVFDCVLLGRKPYIRWGVTREDMALCAAALDRVGLTGLQTRPLEELSGGELQKVMLARALVQQPHVLLLDEPTSNLDPRNQYEMMALVRDFARERNLTVLVVLHDLNLALRYCDRLLFLRDGALLRDERTEAVRQSTIEAVYGIKARLLDLDNRKYVVIE